MQTVSNPPLDLTGIPALEDIAFEGVSPRYRSLRMVQWALAQMFLATMVLAPFILEWIWQWMGKDKSMDYDFWWVPLSAQLVLGSLWLLEEIMGFPRRGFALRERDITYRSGWFNRVTITIPFDKVQHSELSQGPIARMVDLQHLKLFTAGGTGNLKIAGLDVEQAEKLRSALETRIGRQ